jgi:hypothetical protein
MLVPSPDADLGVVVVTTRPEHESATAGRAQPRTSPRRLSTGEVAGDPVAGEAMMRAARGTSAVRSDDVAARAAAVRGTPR